jgi:hypothetical protein
MGSFYPGSVTFGQYGPGGVAPPDAHIPTFITFEAFAFRAMAATGFTFRTLGATGYMFRQMSGTGYRFDPE